MSAKSEKYLNSQAGKLTEEIKKAYLAGQHILYVVTKDYAVVKEAIYNEPIFFLYSKSSKEAGVVTTSSLGTATQENKVVEKQNLFFGQEALKRLSPTTPSLYVVTLKSHQVDETLPSYLNTYLKAFVDSILDLSPDSGNGNLKKSMVIVVTPKMIDIPVEISLYSRIVRVDEPTVEEIQGKIVELVKDLDGIDLDFIPDKQSFILRLTNLTKGLSLNKISQIFSRIKSELDNVYISVNNEDKFKELEQIVLEEKAKLIESSALLKLVKTNKSIQKTSGMEGLSNWLQERKKTILKPDDTLAEAFIPQPKGVLLAGIPGTGKSLAAKTTASEFGNLPLLQLDMGNIMDKYQGESEHKMEEALKLAEAMSPCVLWIDEIEKGIAGSSSSSGSSDSMKRIFGKLLTWMQEKEERGVCCFVFATANNIDDIPPEMFRSGRFDEKFYTFLPSLNECVEIFKSQLASQDRAYRKYCQKNGLTIRPLFDEDIMSESFIKSILNSSDVLREKMSIDDVRVSKENKFMTGSDIEAILQRAKLILYHAGETSKNDSPVYNVKAFRKAFCKAISETRTYGQTNAKQIVECFAKLSEYNFRSVSKHEIVPFRFLDMTSDESQPVFDLKSEQVTEFISNLDSDYDKQLFLYMGIATNQYIKKSK